MPVQGCNLLYFKGYSYVVRNGRGKSLFVFVKRLQLNVRRFHGTVWYSELDSMAPTKEGVRLSTRKDRHCCSTR